MLISTNRREKLRLLHINCIQRDISQSGPRKRQGWRDRDPGEHFRVEGDKGTKWENNYQTTTNKDKMNATTAISVSPRGQDPLMSRAPPTPGRKGNSSQNELKESCGMSGTLRTPFRRNNCEALAPKDAVVSVSGGSINRGGQCPWNVDGRAMIRKRVAIGWYLKDAFGNREFGCVLFNKDHASEFERCRYSYKKMNTNSHNNHKSLHINCTGSLKWSSSSVRVCWAVDWRKCIIMPKLLKSLTIIFHFRKLN